MQLLRDEIKLLNTARAADAETIKAQATQLHTNEIERKLFADERDALREQLAKAIRERDESIREANQLLSGL